MADRNRRRFGRQNRRFNNNNNNNNENNELVENVEIRQNDMVRQGNRRNRAQNFRAAVGDRTTTVFDTRRNNSLFEGFGTVQEYASKLGTLVVPCVRDLHVTTRGIGYMVNELFDRLEEEYGEARMGDCTKHNLFRCALIQFDCKMFQASKRQFEHRAGEQILQHPILNYELTEITLSNPQNFSPISGIISSIGNVTVGNQTYHCGIEEDVNMFTLSYSRLRDYVVLLANVDTPLNVRLDAFANNSIPGADFGEDVANPVLVNANDIMPDDHGVGGINRDFRLMHLLLNYLSRKVPHYMGTVDYSPNGTISSLMTNAAAANPAFWWSSEPMSAALATLGVVARCGEVYLDMDALPRSQQARSLHTAAVNCDVTYDVAVQAMLG